MRKFHLSLIACALAIGLMAADAHAAIVYSNTSETGFRTNPGAGVNNATVRRIFFDDIPILNANLPGPHNSKLKVNSVTVGIRRLAGAPATDVNIYMSRVLGNLTIGAFSLNQPELVNTVSLAANGGAAVTTLVTVTPTTNLRIPLNYTILPGFGTVAVGVQFSNTDGLSGWRINNNISIPTYGDPLSNATGLGAPNLNTFWAWDDSLGAGNERSFFIFSGANPPNPPGTFFVRLDGTAIPEPTSTALLAVAGFGYVATKARKRFAKRA